ncbi:hypothetical protein Hanom_Chr08g00689931 [Helianthus anomalus]
MVSCLVCFCSCLCFFNSIVYHISLYTTFFYYFIFLCGLNMFCCTYIILFIEVILTDYLFKEYLRLS